MRYVLLGRTAGGLFGELSRGPTREGMEEAAEYLRSAARERPDARTTWQVPGLPFVGCIPVMLGGIEEMVVLGVEDPLPPGWPDAHVARADRVNEGLARVLKPCRPT